MLTANRTGVPEGQLRATAVVDAGGVQRQVAVQAGVERDPSVSASVAPTGIRTLSLCGATTARITDTISDESALGSVVLEWGDPVTRTAMSHQGGTWQADVGRVNRAQTLSWRVVATNARGNTGDGNRAGRRMPGHRLIGTSRPCPKRYRCPSGPPTILWWRRSCGPSPAAPRCYERLGVGTSLELPDRSKARWPGTHLAAAGRQTHQRSGGCPTTPTAWPGSSTRWIWGTPCRWAVVGGLALELHCRHPQLPSSLVLASAYAGWAGSLPPEVVQERLQRVMREAELPPAQWVRGYLPGLFTDAAPAALVEEALAMMLEVRPAGMRPMVQGFAEADLRDVLPRIQVPTLLLYGDADRRRPWRRSPATCTPTFPAPGWWSSMGSSINPTWRPPTGSTPRSAAFSGQYTLN
jgi:hypothetical protein